MLQKVRAAGVVLMLYVLSAATAHAMLMDFEFDITFDSGPLDPQTFTGTATLDGYTGIGSETFIAPGGGCFPPCSGTITELTIEIDGSVFTAADDVDFPNSPSLQLSDGVLEFLTFRTNQTLIPRLDISFLLGALNSVTYSDGSGESTGTLTRFEQVPAPSPIALLGLGLAGLVFRGRRKE